MNTDIFSTFTIVLIFLLIIGPTAGCIPDHYFFPLDSKLPDNYKSRTRDFMINLKRMIETQTRTELHRTIATKYGGYNNGRQTLIRRIDEVFSSYKILKLDFDVQRITAFNRGVVTVETFWRLNWRCRSPNPELGCPEKNNQEKFPVKKRRGETVFEIKWDKTTWKLKDQRGNILIGLSNPGESINN